MWENTGTPGIYSLRRTRSGGRGSFGRRLAALQQLHQQTALQRPQLAAAVVLLQDTRQLFPEVGQARRRGAVRDVQQSVEKLLPQLAVGNSVGKTHLEPFREADLWEPGGRGESNLLNTPLVLHTPPSLVTCM